MRSPGLRPLPFANLAFLALSLPTLANAQLQLDDLVVTDVLGARVLAVDSTTGAQTLIAQAGLLVEPVAAAVAPDSGLVYVADRSAGTLGAVIEIDPAAYDAGAPAANQRIVSTGANLENPEGVIWDSTGQLLVADSGSAGGVFRVTIASGLQARLATIVGARGIVVRGGLIYVSTPIGNEILRIDESQTPTEVLSISSTGFFSTLGGLAVEANGDLLVADFDGEIIRIDPDQIDNLFPDANQSLVSDDVLLVNARDVAVGLDGTIYASDSGAANGTVFEIDSSTGVATALSTPLGGTGSAVGLAATRRGLQEGDIVVANTGSFASQGAVVLIDPDTGDQVRLASIPAVKGITIESPTQLVVSAGGGTVTGRVIRVDLATGEETLLSLQQELVLAEEIHRAEDGTLFVGESSNLTFDPVSMDLADVGLVEVDPTAGTQMIEAFDQDFRVLSFDIEPSSGDFITASTNSGFDAFTISRVSNGNRTILATDDLLDTPRGVVVDETAGLIYVADQDEILSLPIAGGPQTSVRSSSIFGSGGLVQDEDGTLLVTVGNSFVGRVFRIDPSDGSAVQIADGGFLLGPRGIDVYRVPEPKRLIGLVVGAIALARLARRPRALGTTLEAFVARSTSATVRSRSSPPALQG